MQQAYPSGVDCAWLASDRNGHLGTFITAGSAPIPIEALNADFAVVDLEDALCKLPPVSGVQLLVSVPRPDSYRKLAERGFYVYDWMDVHQPATDATGAYQPVAIPIDPIGFDTLPTELAALARAIDFGAVIFEDHHNLDVRLHMACVTPERFF